MCRIVILLYHNYIIAYCALCTKNPCVHTATYGEGGCRGALGVGAVQGRLATRGDARPVGGRGVGVLQLVQGDGGRWRQPAVRNGGTPPRIGNPPPH